MSRDGVHFLSVGCQINGIGGGRGSAAPLPPRDKRSGVCWRNIHAAASQSQLSSADVTSHVKKKKKKG